MQRREYIAAAAGGTALLTGGIGAAAATRRRGDGTGNGGGSRGRAVTAEFDVDQSGSLTGSPGAEIECRRRTVEVDGVVEVRDTCHTATLDYVNYDGRTLTVVVEEAQRADAQVCLHVVTPTHYVATVETPTQPETVRVVHRGVSESRFVHECGSAGSATGGAGGGSGDDGGSGAGSSGGAGWW